MDMGSAPGVMTGYDCVESQNTIYATRLHPAKHRVIKLTVVGHAAYASSRDTSVYSLSNQSAVVTIKVSGFRYSLCCYSATSQA
jgi:hypothetical protein